MRSVVRLVSGVAAAALLIVCCALGPAAVVAGVAIGLGGLGLGVWMLLAAGILIAGAGVLSVITRRRRSRATCRTRPTITPTGGDR